jgi:hypothetical protein
VAAGERECAEGEERARAQRAALRQLAQAARALRLRARTDASLLLVCQQRALALLQPASDDAAAHAPPRSDTWAALAVSMDAALQRGGTARGGLALHAELSRALGDAAAALAAVASSECAALERYRTAAVALNADASADDDAFVSADEALLASTSQRVEQLARHGKFETDSLALAFAAAARDGGGGASATEGGGATEVLEAYTGPLEVAPAPRPAARAAPGPAPARGRSSMLGVFGELQQALLARAPAAERTRQLGEEEDAEEELTAAQKAQRRLAGAHQAALMDELQAAMARSAV